MANCPKCGSSDIQLKTDSRQNINWGRAIAGWALFGVVGGAVGSVTGKGKSESITANVCLNCGTIWDAATLYKLLQYIESVTTVQLDLSLKKDRERMDIFINHIQPLVDKVKAIEKSSDTSLSRQNRRSTLIVGLILFVSGAVLILSYKGLASASQFGIGLILSGLFLIGFASLQDSNTKKTKDIDYKLELDKKIAKFVAYI